MTVATNDSLERVYGLVKRHEADLAAVNHSGHWIERDVFGDLLADTRQMGHQLEDALEARRIDLGEIEMPEQHSVVTPKSLIEDRKVIKEAYASALSEFTTQSDVRSCLKLHHNRMTGAGQEKLEILCAAIVGDQ